MGGLGVEQLSEILKRYLGGENGGSPAYPRKWVVNFERMGC